VNRIGQKKPVHVYQLIAENTVESKVIEIQERKKQLIQQVVYYSSPWVNIISHAPLFGRHSLASSAQRPSAINARRGCKVGVCSVYRITPADPQMIQTSSNCLVSDSRIIKGGLDTDRTNRKQ
jgi:hypothetical protein